MRPRPNQAIGRERRLGGGVVGYQRHAVSQHLLGDGAAHGHGLVFSSYPVETEHDTRIERVVGRQQNRATLRGNDFEEQLKQPLKQFVQAADGVDARADFHQRAQIARHQIYRIVNADLQSRPAHYLSFVEVDFARPRRNLAVHSQKHKLRVADSQTIAVLENARLDGHIVDERAVETLEVGDYVAVVLLFDLGVAA